MAFFRRAFRRADTQTESVINLATAFEVLLTDNYAGGVGGRLEHRLGIALGRRPGKKKLMEAFEGLYDARSSYVHAGEHSAEIDTNLCRKAFVIAFVHIVEGMERGAVRPDAPVAGILGLA